MELPAAGDGVNLAAYRPRAPASAASGRRAPATIDEAGYYQRPADRDGVESRTPAALTGYETLDSPPRYDFYANTKVWGRRRHFRPSLYQLYATPEVGTFWWGLLYNHTKISPICNIQYMVIFIYIASENQANIFCCLFKIKSSRH